MVDGTALNCAGGSDEFKDTVVYSTFPANLDENDFGYYVDMTFSDISEESRRKLKGLFCTNQQSYQSQDIIFDYGGNNGKISASLLQIISQKNNLGLEMLVGFVSLIRKPSIGWQFNQDYWQSDKQRVQQGLQYIFANQAQKEISYT